MHITVAFSLQHQLTFARSISLAPVEKDEDTAASTRSGSSKHQAILSIDMKKWRDIIQAFDIRESMIGHRQESDQSGPGARGWYS